MIAGVFALIVVPLLAAGVLSVVRRFHTLSALLAAGVAGALGAGVLWLPLDRAVELGGRQVALGEPMELLGRQLVLGGADRIALGGIFLVAAGLFLIGWQARPGSSFFSLGLALLGILSAALVIRPFLYGSLLLTLAAVLTATLVQGGVPGRTQGALRYLVMATLALPAFLIAAWLMDLYALSPNDSGLARNIAIALLAGFALLLSVVPFHIWIGPAAKESPPVAVVFALTVCNSVVWFLLLDILQEHAWLAARQDVFRILQLLGLLTAGVGGVLAFSSYDFAHVLAYGVLADYGCALVTLGTRTPAGLSATLFATLARSAGLAVLALGIALARGRAKSSEFEALAGLAWSFPWTAAALIIGGFSLAGIPPLPGFLGRWPEVRLLAATQPVYALVMLGVTMGVAAGVLRGAEYVMRAPVKAMSDSPPAGKELKIREPRLMVALIVATLLAGLTLSLFPGMVESLLRAVVSSYTFLSGP
jgi:formate hydrogenlyase subunit 3/multisubunit Na+/H+ antiporter MnhD subunit